MGFCKRKKNAPGQTGCVEIIVALLITACIVLLAGVMMALVLV